MANILRYKLNKLNKMDKLNKLEKLEKLNKLYDTVIRLQRVCGQPCRNLRRGRSTVGVCTVLPREQGGA